MDRTRKARVGRADQGWTRLQLIGLMSWVAAGVLTVCVVAIWQGLIMINVTPSVARGFYVAASSSTAPYVSFCLPATARSEAFYLQFCSQDTALGPAILKRVAERLPDGDFVVIGDHPQSIDSRMIGTVPRKMVRGYWMPILTWGAADAE